MQERDQSSNTRNSSIREMTARPRRAIAEFLDDHTPLTADHISITGTLGAIGGSALAVTRQEEIKKDWKQGLVPLAITLAAEGLDGIDGVLSRLQAERYPHQVDTTKGMLIDVVNDRASELSMSLLRGIAAHKRGDSFGEVMAFTAAATNSLPSLIRANAEALGYPVSEAGDGPLGILGTRVGRAATGAVATVFPRTQPALDGLTTLANITTTVTRTRNIVENKDKTTILSDKDQEDGKIRAKALTAAAGVALAATVFTANKLKTS